MNTKEDLYDAIVDYFGDLSLKMIKNEGGWMIYGAKINSALNQNRYIFAILPAKPFMQEETILSKLDWISFQTRTTDDAYQVPSHNFYPSDKNRIALMDLITVIERSKDITTYRTSSLPIIIKLLHDPKKNNYLQYPDQTKLYQAIETFRCVIEVL